jgi:hypothetical protein
LGSSANRHRKDDAIAPKDEVAKFNIAVRAASETLGGLPRAVRLAIYEEIGNGGLYRPEQMSDEAEEVERALRADLLTYDDETGAYEPNRDDPSIEKAYDAVAEVFGGGWSDDLTGWFRSAHKKNLRVQSQAAWEALGLL